MATGMHSTKQLLTITIGILITHNEVLCILFQPHPMILNFLWPGMGPPYLGNMTLRYIMHACHAKYMCCRSFVPCTVGQVFIPS